MRKYADSYFSSADGEHLHNMLWKDFLIFNTGPSQQTDGAIRDIRGEQPSTL